MSLSESESYVERTFAEQGFPVRLMKLAEETTKTADFAVLASGVRVAVLEVKQLEMVARNQQDGWDSKEKALGIRENTRTRDNGPSRIITDIRRAAKQLRGYEETRILAFVNDELLLDVQDLEEAYNGYLVYSDGVVSYRNMTSKALSEKRIGDAKHEVDLFVWMDRLDGVLMPRRDPRPRFRFGSERGRQLAVQFFGAPADAVA